MEGPEITDLADCGRSTKVARLTAILEMVTIPPSDRLENMTALAVKAVTKVCKVKAKPQPDGVH